MSLLQTVYINFWEIHRWLLLPWNTFVLRCYFIQSELWHGNFIAIKVFFLRFSMDGRKKGKNGYNKINLNVNRCHKQLTIINSWMCIILVDLNNQLRWWCRSFSEYISMHFMLNHGKIYRDYRITTQTHTKRSMMHHTIKQHKQANTRPHFIAIAVNLYFQWTLNAIHDASH